MLTSHDKFDKLNNNIIKIQTLIFHMGGKIMGQIIGEGITFDDVLLVPAYSQVVPNQVDLSTWLTKKIKYYKNSADREICLRSF